jgi:hypothetical protein
MPKKPVALWYFLAGLAATILFFLLSSPPNTLLALDLWLTCIFGLLIPIVWNFWWIERSLWRQILALALTAAVLFVLRIALPRAETTRALNLTFKDSPSLTPRRKERITDHMEAFCRYLVNVGFDAPKDLPPIGVSDTAGDTFVLPGPLHWQAIYMSEKSIDDPLSAHRAYARYAFSAMLDALNWNRPDRQHRILASWVFVDYFVSVFSGKRPKLTSGGTHNWVGALWEVRQECGEYFADKTLLFTLRAFDDPSDKDPKQEFDQYFFERFRSGESVVDNRLFHLPKIREILRRRGLPPKLPG